MAYTGNVVSGLPDWNPDISVIAEPPNDKKLTGWQPDEKPPAQWFNWLNAGFYKSIKEIDDMFSKTSGHGHTGVDGDGSKLDPIKAFTYTPVNKAGDTINGKLTISSGIDSYPLWLKSNYGEMRFICHESGIGYLQYSTNDFVLSKANSDHLDNFTVLATKNIFHGDLILKGHSAEIRRPQWEGGWAEGYTIKDLDDTPLVEFGTHGGVSSGVNTVNFHYIGKAYNDTFMRFYEDKRVTIGGNVSVSGGVRPEVVNHIGGTVSGVAYPNGLSMDITSNDQTYPIPYGTILNIKRDSSRFTQLLFDASKTNTNLKFRNFYVDEWSGWTTVLTDENHHPYIPVALDGSTPMTGRLEVNNWISLKSDGDLILEWLNTAGERQGYIGRLVTSANDSISVYNAISGKYLSIYDSGLMNYTGNEFRLGSNEFSRILSFYCTDGTKNPRAFITHETDIGTNKHKLIFDSMYSTQIGFADFGFLNGKVGIGTKNPNGILGIQNVGAIDDITLISFSEDEENKFAIKGMFAGVGAEGNSIKLSTAWAGDIMTLRGDGRVGIGDAPYKKLSVILPHTSNVEDSMFLGSKYLNEYYGVGLYYGLDGEGIPYAGAARWHGGVMHKQITLKSSNTGINNEDPKYPLDVNGIVRADGPRPIQFDPGAGCAKIKGGTGGWATGYFFEGLEGAFRGGFGAHGGADELNYYYIGTEYNNPLLKIEPSGDLSVKGDIKSNGGGGGLMLLSGGADHAYMSFYPRTATPETRGGYIGYGNAGTSVLTINNEIGNIMLDPHGGTVNVDGILEASDIKSNGIKIPVMKKLMEGTTVIDDFENLPLPGAGSEHRLIIYDVYSPDSAMWSGYFNDRTCSYLSRYSAPTAPWLKIVSKNSTPIRVYYAVYELII